MNLKLLSVHKSGRVVSNGPSAPPSPSRDLMCATEVCTYLRVVAEAARAKDASSIWQPGPAPTTMLKRLQWKKRNSPKGSRVVVGTMADFWPDEDPGAEAAPAAEAFQAMGLQ